MKYRQSGADCNGVAVVLWGHVHSMDIVIAISQQFARDRSVLRERRVTRNITNRHVATIDYVLCTPADGPMMYGRCQSQFNENFITASARYSVNVRVCVQQATLAARR